MLLLEWQCVTIRAMQPNNQAPYSQAPMAPNPYAEFMANPTPPPPQRKSGPWLIIVCIVTLVVLLIFVGLFAWAFSSRQDYKNNVDKKVETGVAARAKVIAAEEEKKYQEREKSPFKSYQGPATYGTISITYPKTWSGFVTEGTSSELIDGYFHPNYVPGLDSGTDFALRVQVIDTPYTEEVKQFDSQVKKGTVKVSPYRAPKMGDVSGTRVDGEIEKGQKNSMVLFPLRDKTIKISTESQDFLKDFEDTILANLTFVP